MFVGTNPQTIVGILYLAVNKSEPIDLAFVSQFENLYIFVFWKSQVSPAALNQILSRCRHLHYVSFGARQKKVIIKIIKIIKIGYPHVLPAERRLELKVSVDSEAIYFKEMERLLDFLKREREESE